MSELVSGVPYPDVQKLHERIAELEECIATLGYKTRPEICADERQRCLQADGGEIELPPDIDEQESDTWWLGFNCGVAYMQDAIRALGDE